MLPILLTMLPMESLKNDMLSRNLSNKGQIPCYEFSTFSDFIQSNTAVNFSAMQNLQSSNQLIINAHGDLSADATGPVIGSDARIYTASEFYNALAPILRQLPHIHTIDLLACNLGIEYNQKASFARELADYLAEEFPTIRVRTFLPQSKDTQLLGFVVESDEILFSYRNKEKPTDMLPREYFEIVEYTTDQEKEREEIIQKGFKDNENFEKIASKSRSLLFNVCHSDYLNNISRKESANEKIKEIYQELKEFQENLDDYEKNILKPYLTAEISMLPELVSKEEAEKLYSAIRSVQHAINLRERRWDQLHNFIKHSAPIKNIEQFIQTINPEIESKEDKDENLQFQNTKTSTQPKNDSTISKPALVENKATLFLTKITSSIQSNFTYEGLFGRRKNKSLPKANNDNALQKKNRKLS